MQIDRHSLCQELQYSCLCKVFLHAPAPRRSGRESQNSWLPVCVQLQFEPLSTLCDVTGKVAYSCTYAGAHTTALRQTVHKQGLCRTAARLRLSGNLSPARRWVRCAVLQSLTYVYSCNVCFAHLVSSGEVAHCMQCVRSHQYSSACPAAGALNATASCALQEVLLDLPESSAIHTRQSPSPSDFEKGDVELQQ